MAKSEMTRQERLRDAGLSERDVREFEACESEIRRGGSMIFQALKKIHDRGLYRVEYATFEEYCEQKLRMSRRHAYRLLQHGKVLENIDGPPGVTNGDTVSTLTVRPIGHTEGPSGTPSKAPLISECATREIADLPAEQQREVFHEATKDGLKPTAKRVKEAREKVAPKADKPRKEKPREVSTAKLVDALISVRLSPARRELAAIADACGSREGPNYKAALDHFEGLLIALKPMREGKP